MSYSLRDLIRASGYAGVAGQSFRNHVSGAGAGAAMSQYKCNGWTFSGEPVPEITYDEGQAFTIAVDFSQGTYADWIKRAGSGLVAITAGLSPYGFDVYNQASTVVGPATGSSVSFNVHAPYASGYSLSGGAYFTGYIPPDEPANSDPADVTFTGRVTAESPTGSDSVSVQISYAPDIGPFNPTLTHEFPFAMYRRSASTNLADYDWQWYSDAGYTTLVTTSAAFVVTSNPGDSTTYYLKAKSKASGTYTTVGAVIFVDDRPAV